MKIKVLGAGCAKCKSLEKQTRKAVEKAGIEAEIEKVEDIVEIMKYNVMLTPALVVDEKVISSGKILSVDEIINLLK